MEYVFFLRGTFSNWAPSKFTLGGSQFTQNEQFMMHSKALLFNAPETAEKILATGNPKEQKALGRQVPDFNKDTWNKHARDLVYAGAWAKFEQNPKLKEELLTTSGKTLVEAASYDPVWGIGLNEVQAKGTIPAQWKGTNWLGGVLTQLREDLIADPAAAKTRALSIVEGLHSGSMPAPYFPVASETLHFPTTVLAKERESEKNL